MSNWLEKYTEWALPQTDASGDFVFWSGIFAIAACLRRRVMIPRYQDGKPLLGGWTCYPFLYLMFVGPPGSRKTTALEGFANELLVQIPDLVTGSTFFTKESLTNDIVNAKGNAVYLMLGEFADVMQKNKSSEIYDMLTSLYDGKRQLEIGTMMRGKEFAQKPCLNMAAGTTPQWISENMGPSVIGGGFASRILPIWSDGARMRKLWFDDIADQQGDFEKMEEDLVHDLALISQMEGEYYVTPEGKKYAEDWNRELVVPQDPRLQMWYGRATTNMLKLSMVHAAATKNELILDERDFQFGAYCIEKIEPSLARIFGSIGRNEYIFDTNDIINYVKIKGSVPLSEIIRKFSHVATLNKLSELISMCVLMGTMTERDVRQPDGRVETVYTFAS